ncbi:transmembrane amino acid transporter protein-domain-containing protein [Chlamydoabsidia padenii]|nr:transmembrane amino acid transporter protein-domain-containing protein [Chlamydoabsidia padenii]
MKPDQVNDKPRPAMTTRASTQSTAKKFKISPKVVSDTMPNDVLHEEEDDIIKSRPRAVRPGMSSRATSFAQSAKRASMGARSYSSFSLYANFAGENLDDSDDEGGHRRRRPKIAEEEKLDEEVVDDHVDGKSAPTASVGKAMFMFLKAFIGSGVLFLPKAFQNGGLALSIVLMVIIACICLVAFLRLVQTQQQIGGSYGDMGGILYSQFLRFTVLFFIVISQIGFVASYFIFVSGNLYNVANVLSSCRNQIEEKYYIWFPLIVLIPLALIRHIARLSFCAILADILILFGLVVIIYFTSDQLYNVGVGPNVIAVNSVNFGMMIGTATFSFEGIGLLIPIVEAMEKPKKFPVVTAVGMLIVTIVYVLIGTLSYLAYGDKIQAAVIYNFPPDNRLNVAVELLYSAAIILTMPFMLFPALKIIENGLFYKFKSGRNSIAVKMSKNFYRVIISVVCAALAFGIGADNLDKFVSLVGSVACVPLCFIFPGMFHIKIAKKTWDKAIDACLMIWGVGIMVYTLYVTINSFVHPGAAEPTTPYCPA